MSLRGPDFKFLCLPIKSDNSQQSDVKVTEKMAVLRYYKIPGLSAAKVDETTARLRTVAVDCGLAAVQTEFCYYIGTSGEHFFIGRFVGNQSNLQ